MSAAQHIGARSPRDVVLVATPRACTDSLTWLARLPAGTTPERAWASCTDGGWLMWFAAMAGVPQRAVIAAACDLVDRSIDAEERAGKEEEIADEKAAVEAVLAAVRAWADGARSELPEYLLRAEAAFAHAAEALCEASGALDRGSRYIAASALADVEMYASDGARLSCTTAAVVRNRVPWALVAAAIGGAL